MYIYSICTIFAVLGVLSYGNPTGMVRESYGLGSVLALFWLTMV